MQITHVISATKETEVTSRRLEIEWQTKVLASFIANIAPSAEVAKDLIKNLSTISLVGDVAVDSTPTLPADTPRERERSLEDIMENGSVEQALARNSQRKGPGLPF